MRDEIALKMHEDLEYRLSTDLFTKVVFFQLRSIDLPNDYEDAIQFTEVTKQSILLAEAQRKKNQVVLDTQIQQAAIAKQITTIFIFGRRHSFNIHEQIVQAAST